MHTLHSASSSSSESIDNNSGEDFPADDDSASSSDNSSNDQASADVSLSSQESGESTEDPSDSEDEDAQVEDEVNTSINEDSKSISSPMEMELDGAIGGTKLLSVGDDETIERTNDVDAASPRNSLSVEDVEEIIKDNNSSGEDGPDSKLVSLLFYFAETLRFLVWSNLSILKPNACLKILSVLL